MSSKEEVIPTICNNDCGGQCVLQVHVRDGVVTRIETDDDPEGLQYRACARGRSHRQWMYAPDRLKYPMKRVGERGEGKFERISWDEALDTVAGELKRVSQTYGPSAILLLTGGGDFGQVHHARPLNKVLCQMGGYSTTWGIASFEGAEFASLATYGTPASANTSDDLLNSKLIIMWGLDVAASIHATNTRWFIAQAREKGTKIVSIDPKYTDSTATFAHQWIPIRPGTDTAMLVAMAYVIVKEGLQDQRFLDTYTIGFDQFRDYVTGAEDGVPKTPAWAEAITGVTADVIANLARKYATVRPAALMPGWGPGHTANGEQFHRACMVLAAMTGNVGIHGGNSGAGVYGESYKFSFGRILRASKNLVDENAPPSTTTLPNSRTARSSARVHISRIWDAMLQGKAGGYPADYKLLYLLNSNYLNQHPNVNKGIRALKTLEFIVTQEQFITPTARFADILLPINYFMERNDVTTGNGTPFYGYMNKIVEPYYESKSHLEIAAALAERLGFGDFEKDEEGLLKEMVAGSNEIPGYDSLKEKGIHKVKLSEPCVAFKKQIEDPQNNPFPTPSGKIEIYSKLIANLQNPLLPPIPKHLDTWESPSDPLAQKYPLQLINSHPKLRSHSRFYNVPWLTELEPQTVIINTSDALARGIRDGDLVRVFNDRGAMVTPSKVTQRIMPGVADIPEGAWYTPDENGVDRGGCCNVLTRDEPAPGGSFACNTCLVQIEKATGGK